MQQVLIAAGEMVSAKVFLRSRPRVALGTR
jgi:hypothetical protein